MFTISPHECGLAHTIKYKLKIARSIFSSKEPPTIIFWLRARVLYPNLSLNMVCSVALTTLLDVMYAAGVNQGYINLFKYQI